MARSMDQINTYKNITSINKIDTTFGLIAWYPLQSDTKDLITDTYLTQDTLLFTPIDIY